MKITSYPAFEQTLAVSQIAGRFLMSDHQLVWLEKKMQRRLRSDRRNQLPTSRREEQ